uniref:Family membership protein n=1 Tax=Byssovorax cruenta TaxID=293647 RepID=A0A3S5GXZ3_9BACT|nr:family membership protein [Byssovorax cruenta]
MLVVEDEPDIRETLRDILEMEGYRVRCASNGKEALDALAEMRPRLILLDLMMPVMSGYEFLQRLRENDDLSTIPVAVVSAVGDQRAVSDTTVLRKPVDLDTLLHVVDEQCGECRAEAASR